MVMMLKMGEMSKEFYAWNLSSTPVAQRRRYASSSPHHHSFLPLQYSSLVDLLLVAHAFLTHHYSILHDKDWTWEKALRLSEPVSRKERILGHKVVIHPSSLYSPPGPMGLEDSLPQYTLQLLLKCADSISCGMKRVGTHVCICVYIQSMQVFPIPKDMFVLDREKETIPYRSLRYRDRRSLFESSI